MKCYIEAEMITGTKYTSIATDVSSSILEVFYNLDDASNVQLPLTETECVILNPKHIVSLRLTEVME